MKEPTHSLVDVRNLVKTYGQVTAIDNVSVELDRGQFIGLLGPNGAGKTTLLKCISYLILPTEGTIALDGTSLAQQPSKAREAIGYAAQDPELYEYLTGEELLQLVGLIRGLNEADLQKRTESLLQSTGLTDARDRAIAHYSGGMRRKISLASALIGQPDLLILDEAFTGLDPHSVGRMERELHRACQQGATVVFCSHMLDLLERICGEFVIMEKGRIRAHISSQELTDADHDSLMSYYLHLLDTGDAEAARGPDPSR